MPTLGEERMGRGRDLVKSYKGRIWSSCFEQAEALKCSVVMCDMGSFQACMVNESDADILKYALSVGDADS